MIEKTEAICLRCYPVSDTSRVVVWLSREAGKLATLIKGALRPKSLFLGQYDLFYTCELLYYPRPHDQLHLARECAPLNNRAALRGDWKGSALASYACSLANRVLPSGEAHGDLYDALATLLDTAASGGAGIGALVWFELRLLECLGLQPRLGHCVGCGTPLAQTGRPARFSARRGGLLCSACDSHPGDQPISADALAILQNWQRSTSIKAARSTRLRRSQENDMADLLGAFLGHHLVVNPNPLAGALDALVGTIDRGHGA